MGYILRSGGLRRIVVARVRLGGDLFLMMEEIAEKENIRAGVILSAVGALSRASMRNVKTLPEKLPIREANRFSVSLEGPFEILSVSGNISEVEGRPTVHAHITLSAVRDDEVISLGGHLTEGCIACPFVELVIAELEDISMRKALDDETGTYQLFHEAKGGRE